MSGPHPPGSGDGPVVAPAPIVGSGAATVELAVSGMHCPSCATLIEEVLGDLDGVRAASVDLEGSRARVEYDSDRLSIDDLSEAVTGAGYPARSLG